MRRRKYIKLSLTADLVQQIICTIKIRRAPTRHDTIDFQPLITKTSEILPLSLVIGDKGYDSEDNHVLVRLSSGREKSTNVLKIVVIAIDN